MPKSITPKSSPPMFQPELVATLKSILDAAVEQIDGVNRTSATKAKMAERMLRVASAGITDSSHLMAVAVEEGRTPAD